MPNFIVWMETYQTQLLTGGFFALQVLALLLLFIVARRVRRMRRQIRAITEKVEQYLAVVMEPESPGEPEPPVYATIGKSREEEENRLICAVLKEIFP
jgi:hypothetical protein